MKTKLKAGLIHIFKYLESKHEREQNYSIKLGQTVEEIWEQRVLSFDTMV